VHNLAYFGYLIVAIFGVIFIYFLAHVKCLPDNIRPGKDVPLWVIACGLGAIFWYERIGLRVTWPPANWWDFLNAYYPAGEAVLHKDTSRLSDLISKGTTGFVNIPVMAYVFAPLAMLSPGLASIVITIIGMALLILTWFMLVGMVPLQARERWLLAVLFLANGPLLSGVKYGNLSYFVLPAMAGGLLLIRSGRSGFAGVLLGLATVIKPPLALFGLYFLLRRDWRGLAGYSMIGLSVTCLSLLLFGWAANWQWFETSIIHYSSSWLSAFNVQSMPAFLLRLQRDAPLMEWLNPQMPSLAQKLCAQIFIGLLLLVTVLACFRLRDNNVQLSTAVAAERRDVQYLLVICLCVVMSPLTWSHYYSWLLMPAAFFLGSHSAIVTSRAGRTLGWAAIGLVTPLIGEPWALTSPVLSAAYRTIVIPHYLFGGLIWFALIAWWLSETSEIGNLFLRLGVKAKLLKTSTLTSLDRSL